MTTTISDEVYIPPPGDHVREHLEQWHQFAPHDHVDLPHLKVTHLELHIDPGPAVDHTHGVDPNGKGVVLTGDTLREVYEVLGYVSLGRQHVGVTRYPDATARKALEALPPLAPEED